MRGKFSLDLTKCAKKAPFQQDFDAVHRVPIERGQPRFWSNVFRNKKGIMGKGMFRESYWNLKICGKKLT